MAWFRRSREDQADTAADSAATGANANADTDVARAERQPAGDWMTMPPLKTTVQPMPPTFRVQTLPEILSSHHDTRLSGTLGHAVSAEAPSGAVHGLATHSGEVHADAGHGDLMLHTRPHHEAAPQDAPVVQTRRLGTVEPLIAPVLASASLPPPTVSRVLANPAPLPAPTQDARPLPVARVVDEPASSPDAAWSPVTSISSPAAEPPTFAPLARDDRVGGFGASFEDLAQSTAEPDTLRAPAPPDLAPPIQPRTLQRRAENTASTALQAPATTTAAPDTSSTDEPATPESEADDVAPLVGGSALPGDDHAGHADDLDGGSSTPGADLLMRDPGSAFANDTDDVPAQRSEEPDASPLAAGDDLPVNRLADSPAPLPVRTLAPSALPLRAATPPRAHSEATPALAPPIQRLAEVVPSASTGSAPSAGAPLSATADDTADDDVELPSSATGPATDAPLLAGMAPSSLGPQASMPETPQPGAPAEDMALASPAGGGEGEPATLPIISASGLATPDRAPEPEAEPEEDAPLATSPTLGGDDMLTAQLLSETTLAQPLSAPTHSTAGLPLAPAEQPGTLTAPSPRAFTDEASAETAPRTSPTLSSASVGAAASIGREAGVSTSASGAGSGPAGRTFDRPLAGATSGLAAGRAASAIGLQRSTEPWSPPTGGGALIDDRPVVLRRFDSSHDAMHSADSANVQRAADVASASSAAPSSSTSALPLHTAAASIPSAAAVAVRAGLAERQSDGSLLYTSPPGVSDGNAGSGFAVQRSVDELPGGEVVERELAPSAGSGGSSAASAPPSAAPTETDPKDLDKMARKLYRRLRSEMQADLRRQLESRSRAGRYRT